MKPKDLEILVNETLINEVRRVIMEENTKERYVIKQDDEPVDYANSEVEANKKLDDYKASHPDKQFVLEKDDDSEEPLFEKLTKMVDKIDDTNNKNMKTEQKSRTLKLTENQMIDLIEKMVNETTVGLDAVKRSHEIGGKETAAHTAAVEKKIKDYLKFDGNDNPEFPKPIGKGDKMSFPATDEETEQIEDERGDTLLDLDYEQEPSEKFKERLKMALEGDPSMGNSHEWVNSTKSDLGKDIQKNVERKRKKEEKKPMYNKDPQPVNNQKTPVYNKKSRPVNENIVTEEIDRMKKMIKYNEKTQ